MNLATYSPGLHLLLTLKTENGRKLIAPHDFLSFTEQLLGDFSLEKVGVSSHTFENGSFTMAVCLMESHICIHTWPEFSQATLDVYLCNYLQDNSEKVREVGARYLSYFEAEIIRKHEIWR